MSGTIYEAPRATPKQGETIITSTCGHNCGGRCVVNAHVRDGRIAHISTDARRWNPDHPPLPACARGVGQIERTYHPGRLQYPMRRTGPRGAGQFERITWDEALDTVAREMLRVRQTYGNAAILDASRTGSQSMLHGRVAAQRFLYMFGGCTDLWSNMSAEAEVFSVRVTYGSNDYKSAGREPTDFINSKLILMWGWSPGDGTFGTGTMQYLKHAKKNGTRIICVDPRVTMTSRQLADEHIFIRPSKDTAALIAMAYVIVTNELQDQSYCNQHVLGLDEGPVPPGASYKSYLLGLTDGQPKTPEWAAGITGIPAETITRLAIEFATTKPAAIQAGYAAGRTTYGEQFHRAAYALAAITGNVGISGGSSGVSNGATGRSGVRSLPTGRNPIDAKVASPLLADLLSRGKAGGYPADIRLIYSSGGDLFNQCPNVEKIASSLDNVEFIVAQDHFLTPTARFADIVLPATTFWERNDVHTPWAGAGHYAIYMRQAIEPMYECRNDIDIFDDLSRRVGINGYNTKSESEWLRHLTADAVDDFEAFTEQGVARFQPPKDAVAFAPQIRGETPFATPSGKIEIYSREIAANPNPYGLGIIPPIPTWMATQDDTTRFPLSLCTPKSRARTHSIHANQPSLARVDPDTVWMNPVDAAARNIADGKRVRVFNDVGATILPAQVTGRIAPGVVSIKEGAWYHPDAGGIDQQGCANVLTIDRSAPCGATTYNTNQVEIEQFSLRQRSQACFVTFQPGASGVATKSKKTSPTWSDIKARLADFDRAGLTGVIQDLYAVDRGNQSFLHARFGLGDDVLAPYKTIIDRWLWPDVIKNQNTSVTTAKKAIADFKKAVGQPAALADLMVFYCERAAGFCAEYGFENEGYFNALVRMFEQALRLSLTLSAEPRDAMLDRLDAVRDISHNLGYGVGDDMDHLLDKLGTR